MLAGLDIATFLLIILGVIVVYLLIDLLLAGGAMSGSMASGVCGMMGGLAGGMAGAWWLLLPLLIVIIILFFFERLEPMWPMGPMMNYSNDWLIIVLVAPFILVVGAIAFVIVGSRGTRNTQKSLSAEEFLRERYAKGEISRQQYLDALVDILKDRCTRGEIELDEYERRLDLLLQEPTRERRRELERKE